MDEICGFTVKKMQKLPMTFLDFFFDKNKIPKQRE